MPWFSSGHAALEIAPPPRLDPVLAPVLAPVLTPLMTMTHIVTALDAGRAVLLRALFRVRPLRPIFADPRRRIPVASVASVGIAAGGALAAPLVSLWIGAAVFGVPHLVAGLRETLVRGKVERGTRLCALLGILVGIAQILGVGDTAVRAFALLFTIAGVVEILAARASVLRTTTLVVPTLVAGAVACAHPVLFLLVMTHLHALSSVAYAGLGARRRGIPAWPLYAATAAVLCAGLLGLLDPLLTTRLLVPRSAAVSILAEARGAAFEGASAIWLRRGLFLYAFGQALHFAVWLRLVPDVERPAKVPQTFRRSLGSFRADLGPLALPALAACALAIPAILIGGGAARESYFALTFFHFGLEAAAVLRVVARNEARAPWRKPILFSPGAPRFQIAADRP